jgi:transposase
LSFYQQSKKEETDMKVTTIGLDIAKNVFHMVELDQHGKQIHRKKLRRSQLMQFFVQHPIGMVAMESCAGSHYWAKEFIAMGHEVKLLPPQHVKGYLRGQKNDYNDATAIAEACQHGRIRAVAIKGIEQLDEQAFHRIRRQLVGERNRIANQIRGLLGEYGIVLAKGVSRVRSEIPSVLEDADNGLSHRFRDLLSRQYQRFIALDEELGCYAQALEAQVKTDDVCRRLAEMPGFGPVVSSAYKSWLGDGKQFGRGRHASAALGVVPGQHSTGGKEVLLGITKRGDSYVRSLVIHGARSVVSHAGGKTDPLSQWINRLVATRGFNKAVVALANKLVRIAWVIVARGESYSPQQA